MFTALKKQMVHVKVISGSIMYSDIEMAEYLKPFNSKLTIEQKQKIFAIRNRMIEISENFPGKEISSTCHCGTTETILHIYFCEQWKATIFKV